MNDPNYVFIVVFALIAMFLFLQDRHVKNLERLVKKQNASMIELADTWAKDFTHHIEMENKNIDLTNHSFIVLKDTLEVLEQVLEQHEKRMDRIVEDVEARSNV